MTHYKKKKIINDDIYHMDHEKKVSISKKNEQNSDIGKKYLYVTTRDEIMVPVDGEEYFDKKIVHFKIMTKRQFLKNYNSNNNDFPNALLMESKSFDKKGSLFENSCSNQNSISEKKNETENVWDLLNQIKTTTSTDTNKKIINNVETETGMHDNNAKICKNCSEKDSFTEDPYTSTLVCLNCGMVNEEILDHNAEWRQYNNEDSRTETVNRCGGPSNYFFPQSSQGTIISGGTNNRLKRKQKWLSMAYKERCLTKEFDYITQICLSNGIKKCIIDTAKIMYKKISDCKHKSGKNTGGYIIIRGDNRISVMATCVSKACETNREPRDNHEIAKMFGISVTRLTKGHSIFDRIKKNCDDQYIFDQLHSSIPDDYIRCHCKKLNISHPDTELAVKIANNCCKMKLATNHSARSIAAGSILTMVEYNNLDIEKIDIVKLSKTSAVTIKTIYEKLMPYIDALVDNDLTDHIIKKFNLYG